MLQAGHSQEKAKPEEGVRSVCVYVRRAETFGWGDHRENT